MRTTAVKLLIAVTLLIVSWRMRCSAQALLTWNTNTDPTVAGYYLVWGIGSSNYTATNPYPAGTNSAAIYSLTSNKVYYFNIAAYDSSATPSPYAEEVVFTNIVTPGSGATISGTTSSNISSPTPITKFTP